MSFENIQLPPFLVQDLYKNFLIDTKTEIVLSHSLKNSEITVLGSNKKNIVIILKDATKGIIDKKDLAFLEGVLKACNMKVEDIAIININGQPDVDYSKLLIEFAPEKIMLFGVGPEDIKLPLVFPNNQIQQHISQLYVSFPSLKNIADEKPLKQALWATLQKLFNLA